MLHSGYGSGLPVAAIGSLLWCEKWRCKPHVRIWIASDRVRLPWNLSALATNDAQLPPTGWDTFKTQASMMYVPDFIPEVFIT